MDSSDVFDVIQSSLVCWVMIGGGEECGKKCGKDFEPRGACPQRDYDAGYYAIMDASGMKLSYPIISALDISQTISSR